MQQHLDVMRKILLNQLTVFHQKIQHGCVFVCSTCHQTNFEDKVLPVQNLQPPVHSDLLKAFMTIRKLPMGGQQSIKGMYVVYQLILHQP